VLSELFEVALVVDDLHRAMNKELAGLRPASPYQSRVAVRTAAGVSDVELTITYTMTGPLHLEIIERVPDTMYATVGIHHYGWFSDDLVADSASLAARGMPLVATRDSDTGDPWQFAYHDCPPFGTIELVDARMRPFLRDWWKAGRPSAGLFRRSFGSLSESWRA
jgi:hypothetical protein